MGWSVIFVCQAQAEQYVGVSFTLRYSVLHTVLIHRCLFIRKLMLYLMAISEFLTVKDRNLIHLLELIYSVACSLRPTFFLNSVA